MAEAARGLVGIFSFMLLAWLLGRGRRAVNWRFVLAGLGLQFGLALLLLKVPGVSDALFAVNRLVGVLEEVTARSAGFMFGYLGGGELPFAEIKPGASYIVAFRVLPLVLVVSALSSVLFYVGLLPWIIRQFARLLRKSFGVSGALGFGAAASVFMGIIETPILVRPYLAAMGRAELFTLITCAMATVSGTVMVLYAGLVGPYIPGAMGHILTASVISVPAALLCAHLMDPAAPSAGHDPDDFKVPAQGANIADALMRGTTDGARMCVNIAASIIVMFAMVHLVNKGMNIIPGLSGLTLQGMLGWLLRPLVWLAGVPWVESAAAGELMGVKTILNEFVAYLQFSRSGGAGLSARSSLIMMYAMCGFANLGSLGIVVGGLAGVLPDRTEELFVSSARAVAAGTLATLMTGAVIGILY